MHSRRGGFTLIETLVVISIIAVLIGLLLPALHRARLQAKVTRARREVKELKEAWDAYFLEYRTWPPHVGYMDSNYVAMLMGTHTVGGTNVLNPRNMAFLDFRSGTEYYCDPWGTPGNNSSAYMVEMDEDGDNMVDLGGGNKIGASVAVWSKGPDRLNNTADDICSWKD